jgi:6-phosphofructokinase 2
MNIVTVTVNPAIDTNTRIDHVLSDKKLRCEKPIHEPGGGGINVSRAIKILGGESAAVFTMGGMNGERLIKLLEEEGVHTSPVKIKDTTRENFSIDETASDKNYRFVMPGPSLDKNEWESIIERIIGFNKKAEFVVISGSLSEGVPEDFYAQVTSCCKDLKVIIDSSGKPLKRAFDEGVYLIKPNLSELTDLLGEEIEDENKLAEETQKLIKHSGTQYIVLSLGSGGAILIKSDSYKHFRSPTVKIKSKVGAGDSMVAGIVLSLSKGESIEYAVKYGIAAGASAVSTPGTQLCEKKSVDKLFKDISSD